MTIADSTTTTTATKPAATAPPTIAGKSDTPGKAEPPPESKAATTDKKTTIQDLMNSLKIASPTTGTGVAGTFDPHSAQERPQGLTQFIDAAPTLQDPTGYETPTDTRRKLLGPDTGLSNLDRTFERPTFLSNINWTSSTTAGTLLSFKDLPSDIFPSSAVKIQKLQYNQFMTADIVVRLQASPVQFQAGRLWVAWDPYRNVRAGRQTVTGRITQLSGLPGISFDPGSPSPVELRIPFGCLISAWDMPVGQFGFGTLMISVLSPLVSASTTNLVTLTLAVWLENVELRVPTQAKLIQAPTRSLGEFDDGPKYVSKIMPTPEVFKFQSMERKQAQSHYFSSFADKVATAASILGEFPILSSVAKPVAILSRAVAKTAAAFGFSKPPDISNATKFFSHNRANWTNADGPLPLVKLATSVENTTDFTSQPFPAEVDEMDIRYICKNPAVVNSWAWSTTDGIGSLVTVLPIHPGVSNRVLGPGQVTFGTYAPTPMAYVASMFKYWAGTISIKLEAVSTPFHAGRLMLAYVPDYDPFGDYTIADMGNNYSIVWDITDSSVLSFDVPYMSNQPYLNCMIDDQLSQALLNGETSGVQARNRMRKVMPGVILVFVLNQLVAPSTASSSISILNWYGAGDDITFAQPVSNAYAPVDYSKRLDYTGKWYDGTDMTAPSFPVNPTRREQVVWTEEEQVQDDDVYSDSSSNGGSDVDEVDNEIFVYQSAMGFSHTGFDHAAGTTSQKTLPKAQFIPPNPIDPHDRARVAMGEAVTNLRVLTRRMTPAYEMYPQNVTATGAWSGVTPPTNNHVLVLDPDYFGTAEGTGDDCIYKKQIAPTTAGQSNWLTEVGSTLSYISYLYAFARGSRVYGISARPSNIIGGSKFATLGDEIDLQTDKGTFDMRLSMIQEEDSPPRQPYFRPDEQLLGYNYTNLSYATINSFNFNKGFNNALSGNFAVQKSGESGCAIVAQVPMTTKYPFHVISNISSTEAAYIAANKYNALRSRRFLEIRYRPFSTQFSTTLTTFTPKIWPFPLTIMEAGGDDFSFGGLIAPPLITRIAPIMIVPDYSTGTKITI